MNNASNMQPLPDEEAVTLARASATELSRLLAEKPVSDCARVSLDGRDLVLPRYAVALLRDLLAEMAQGNAVTVVPTHAELTTQEAANLLNVSRPHLVKLLDQGKMEFTKTGSHRRTRYRDLMAYKQARHEASEAQLDELTHQAQEHDMGY